MHHHRLKREILVVEVQEDATDFFVTIDNFFEYYLNSGATYCIRALNDGNWQFLSKGNEITEEQAGEILPMELFRGISLYPNYESEEDDFSTALSSFQSFLKSNNYTPEKVVILVKEK